MKKLLYIIFGVMGALMFIQCSDWTEMEPKFTEPVNINGEDYYKALREYKKSDHPIVFGWYSEWTGTGTNMNNQLRGIPDSMDIVSLWGGAFNLTEAQKSDLKEVREKKGLRVLYCQHITDIGRSHTPASVENDFIVDGVQYNSKDEAMAAYWGWYGNYGDTSEEGQEKAIRKYARVIIDSINKYNYDGFDIDYEPNYGNKGNIVDDDDRMFIFVDELGKHFGPKSGTGKLLIIDGEPQSIKNRPDVGPYFDYFIIQAYKPGNDNNLDKRLIDGGVAGPGLVQTYGSVMSEEQITKMTIMTENFEAVDAAMDGGYPYTDRYGNSMKSLEGMARWQPKNGFRKGGVGSYHMEAEYPTNPEYKNLRKAIQIMNPSTKPLIKY